jgi:putative oxidoreductase
VALGVVMFAHGAQKMLGWWGGGGFSTTMEMFTGQGMPSIVAFLVIVAEFFGGLGLILGLLGRVSAFGILCVMLGAIALVHARVGFFMNWAGTQGGEGFEYHLLALALSSAIVVRGSGALSLDAAIWRSIHGRGEPEITHRRAA